MRIHLFIGPTSESADRFYAIARKKRAPLQKSGVLAPDWNPVRLHMACADPAAVGLIRFKRGYAGTLAQRALYDEIGDHLARAVKEERPDHLVLANGLLGAILTSRDELERLRALLNTVSGDIHVTAHVDEQARMLAPHYASQVMEGRRHTLELELELARQEGWWAGARALRGETQPWFGLFNDIQYPAPWLDYEAMVAKWEAVFGAGSMTLRPLDRDRLRGADAPGLVAEALGIEADLGKIEPGKAGGQHSAATLGRVRAFNDLLIRYMQAKEISTSRNLWRTLTGELRAPGPPIAPGALSAVSKHFEASNRRLVKRWPDLAEPLKRDRKLKDWAEADGGTGFRASQYLTAFAHRIRNNSRPIAELRQEAAELEQDATHFDDVVADEHGGDSGTGQRKMLDKLKAKHQIVLATEIRPHNDMGRVNEAELAAAYEEVPMRKLPEGNSGNVIVGCMKNEAPYILEWIAYHRAMGVDNFLIYTNACDDGTTELLDHLQEMGIVQHRDNNDWKGKSPQQHALNQSLNEPIIKGAEWIIHIDVDEFINVRTGNGTLEDLFKATRGATNIAMTWRLFGHNGVHQLKDAFVIEQFDSCAPKYCPKPHTVWGFKSMFKNISGYRKISCHRPNQVIDEKRPDIKWVNGSGRDVTEDYIKGGWRSSKKTVGYDLVQLNHYALRSAESFLIKRQRGRALHVDRSIGLNYWIRMDWSDFKDITIKRNIPRARAEYDRLMSDPKLRALHEAGLKWHKEKVEALHKMPEFQELYAQALKVNLTETERVAYALSLDMES